MFLLPAPFNEMEWVPSVHLPVSCLVCHFMVLYNRLHLYCFNIFDFILIWCNFLLSFLYYTNSILGKALDKPNTPASWINNCFTVDAVCLWCWLVTRMWEQFSAEVSLTLLFVYWLSFPACFPVWLCVGTAPQSIFEVKGRVKNYSY